MPPLVLRVEPASIPLVLPAPRPPHPGFWWAVLWCIGFLFVTQLIPGIAIPIVAIVVDIARSPDPQRAAERLQRPDAVAELERQVMMPTLAASVFLGILMSWAVLRLVVGKEWTRKVALRRPAAAHVLLACLAVPTLLVLGDVVYSLASRVLPKFADLGLPDMSAIMKQVQDWPTGIAVLIIGLGPGIGEELWCRGFLGRGLVGRYGAVVGVLLTSFLFGLLHIDPPHASAAMMLGLVLHFVYLTTRSLWLPMLMHFVNNSLSVLAGTAVGEKLPGLKALERAAEHAPIGVPAASALLLLAVGWALYRSRARLVAEPPHDAPLWHSDFPGVEYPTTGSGTEVHSSPDWLSWILVAAAAAIFALTVFLRASAA